MTPEQDRIHPPPDGDLTHSANALSTATGEAAAALRDLLTVTGVTGGPPPAGPQAIDPPPGFVLEREIGVGGMGVVYLARQLGLNRPVALKLVKGSDKLDAKAVIRFLAEAEAVAAVRHPNVVEVYQYGDHQGKPYLALEYCPGGDLTTLSKAEQTRDAGWFRRVADLMAAVSDGVNAAHALGIVHRDLKPHNVFLTADGTPKVADFGLAKRGLGSDLTNTEAVMGTPAYMSPEQAGGGTKFVGPESDVWSLGVMLYELASGERPFAGDTPLELISRVIGGDVPKLNTKCPAVPAELALLAHKCLSKDPRDRYLTAGELAADLRNWLAGRSITAKPAGAVESAVKWARRNKVLAGAAASVAVTLVVAVAVSLTYAVQADRSAADARTALAQRDAALEAEKTGRAEAAEKRREITAKVITFVSERPTLLTLDRGLFIDAFHDQFPDVGKNELIRTIAVALTVTEEVDVPVEMPPDPYRAPHPGQSPKAGQFTPAVKLRTEKVVVRRVISDRVPLSPVAVLTGFAPMTKNLGEISDAFARQSEGGTQVTMSSIPNMFGD
jgi:hypothetical protein